MYQIKVNPVIMGTTKFLSKGQQNRAREGDLNVRFYKKSSSPNQNVTIDNVCDLK